MDSPVIWIIDDDMVALFATTYKIQQCCLDYKVVSYHSIENALSALERSLISDEPLPNILLLDISFPTLSGWHFLQKIEKDKFLVSRMDIYILSAFSDSKDSKRALKHPLVKGYFYKPVTKAELNVVINS